MKKEMPKYFDDVVAKAVKKAGLKVGLAKSEAKNTKQVIKVLKSLHHLAEEHRYTELLGHLFNCFYRYTREAGDIQWSKDAVVDVGRQNNYPLYLAEVDPSSKKRQHRLMRMAKMWATASPLQSLRNGQVK